MENKEQEDIVDLKVNFMKIQTDISYIKEKLDNLDDFKKEIREAIKTKVDRRDFIIWRNIGISLTLAFISGIIGLLIKG